MTNWSLKRKQSVKRKCIASNRENIASNARAGDIGKDGSHALFRHCHASAIGETNRRSGSSMKWRILPRP